MMGITVDWQTAVALACVAIAVGYLMRRMFVALTAPHRSSCAGCPQSPATGIEQKPLVTLESVARSGTHLSDSNGKVRNA